MRLSEKLAMLEASFHQLAAEFAEMNQQVVKLEEENERLRQQLAPAQLKTASNTGGGQQMLRRLYEEGYHVCPANYGREHDGGCLFCLEVLKNVTRSHE